MVGTLQKHYNWQDDSAIVYYTKTIDLGKQETTYFAARAALQLAVVYEDKKNYKMAATYFAQSMKMKNKEYKNSIDMRAKAGLQRVSK
jgi:predicted negative regulator of RcsB-dependent stress response